MKIIKRSLCILALIMLFISNGQSQFMPPTCPGHASCGESGGEADVIILDWPNMGNIANEPITVRWMPVSGATSYRVTIRDNNNSVSKFNTTTSENKFRFEFPIDGVNVGETFTLMITANTPDRRSSNQHKFTLKTPADFSTVESQLQTDDLFTKLGGIDRDLRKAEFFHENGWNLAAARAHNINVASNNPLDAMKIIDHFKALLLKLDPPK